MRLVGLCGRPGSGRNTVAKILAVKGFFQVRVDMPIVCGLQAMFGLSISKLRDPNCQVVVCGKHIRSDELIDSLSDWAKGICGNSVWLTTLEDHLAHWALRETLAGSATGLGVVVPDCTAESADVVRRLGGQVWHLYDRILTGRPILQTDGTLDFGSDAPFRNGDKAIDNSGNVDDLKSAVECLLLEMDR